MFERMAYQGHSGRTIKLWLDRIGFETRNGKRLAVSKVYAALKNPFYYGGFEFPVGSGTWYKGKHKPLITKELFDKAQIQLQIQPDKGYKNKLFPFKKIFKCGGCDGGITAEEKYRKLLTGRIVKHIYYHCGRSLDYECNEPYITESDLIRQLIAKIDDMKFNHAGINRKIQEDIERYHRLKSEVLNQEYLTGNLQELTQRAENVEKQTMMKNYLKHILTVGTAEERQEALSFIKTRFILSQREISIQK